MIKLITKERNVILDALDSLLSLFVVSAYIGIYTYNNKIVKIVLYTAEATTTHYVAVKQRSREIEERVTITVHKHFL